MDKYKSLTETLEGTSQSNDLVQSLNQAMCLNEMVQINLGEKGNKKSNLNSDVYYVYVKGEGGYKKFPHFHLKHIANGWDIRMNIDGTFHSIKKKGKGMQNKEDAEPISRIAQRRVKENNILEPDRTNGQVAELSWYRNNS